MPAYVKPEQKQASKAAVQKKDAAGKVAAPNQTGIPDSMKTRFENLSGFSFDDVHVHYNSDKPAQLQALAYTQGNQVYVASGQEKHLKHELGHVVQQKRGVVRPTMQLGSVAVNDNKSLEREADIMGDKTAQHSLYAFNQQNKASANVNPLQMYKVQKDSTGTKLEATTGRPAVPDNIAFVSNLVDQIWAKPYSQQEDQLKKKHLTKASAVFALRGTYRSTYGAAFCHKMSISEVEDSVVDYANNPARNKAEMSSLLQSLTDGYPTISQNATDALDDLTATTTDETAANTIVESVNESPANYYLGHSPTNSSIGDRFDPHLDISAATTTAPLSPISASIQHWGEALGRRGVHPFKAQETFAKYGKTSCVGTSASDGIGWAQIEP